MKRLAVLLSGAILIASHYGKANAASPDEFSLILAFKAGGLVWASNIMPGAVAR